ncbi:kelch-like [Perkinsus olseni]|uniref:Kelch-like n=1 Tax=Perkinsus olseni TaxID=32597 RepID=A0A7J6UH23_PEROL|nr:kelch-like [Perkinsus olseni]KAF4703613.1 kelch-like [Perkinsus olseni]KAF4756477.1 kelch-like [Perkinsus olseni]
MSTVEVRYHRPESCFKAADLQRPRVAAAIMPVGKYFYIVGGYRVHPSRPLGCVEIYSPWLNKWTRFDSSMQLPRFGHGLALVENRYLYAIGGTSKDELVSEVEILDTHTNKWIRHEKKRIHLPRPLTGGRVLENNGRLFIVGGVLRRYPPQLSDLIYILDTTTTPCSWSVLSVRLSAGRSSCGVAWLDESRSCFGVFGGNAVINRELIEVSTTEVVSLDSQYFVPLQEAATPGTVSRAAFTEVIPDMPTARAGCYAVKVGSRVVVIGGDPPSAALRFHLQEAMNAGELHRPAESAHSNAFILDMCEWTWAKEGSMFTGRSTAAICIGFAPPVPAVEAGPPNPGTLSNPESPAHPGLVLGLLDEVEDWLGIAASS